MNWQERYLANYNGRRARVAAGLPLKPGRRLTWQQYDLMERLCNSGFEVVWTGSGFVDSLGNTVWPQTMDRLSGCGLIAPDDRNQNVWRASALGREWMNEE